MTAHETPLHPRLGRRDFIVATMVAVGAALLGAAGPAAAQAGARASGAAGSGAAEAPVPTIARRGEAQQLIVDGRPFIILGGELDNSAASSPSHMAAVWDRVAAMGVNTLLAPVSWNQLEPTEGRFDFSAVDDLVAQARWHDMRLGLLWFGAFKNARSTYAPTWVRADRRRFPRAILGRPERPTGAFASTLAPVLSAFTPALVEADGRAFATLMRHLDVIDPDHRVILVQVENETGLLGDSRDRSPAAEAAWRGPVPPTLIRYLVEHAEWLTPELATLWSARGRRRQGSWADVFGTSAAAHEMFMAWTFGAYVEAVARRGRSSAAPPFYSNAWLGPTPGEPQPGDYPSGGPTAATIDVWKAAAPTLAMVSPDIYVDDARSVQARYARADNPLLIPEERFRPGNLFWALGHHKAIGQATYSIDFARPGSQLEQAYKLLAPMLSTIAQAQADGRIAAVLLDGDETRTVRLDGYEFTVRGADAYARQLRLDAGQQPAPAGPALPSETTDYPSMPDTRPFGLILALGDDRFVFAGQGFYADATKSGQPVEVDRVEESAYRDGVRTPGRWLNGDEYGQFVPRNRLGTTEVRFLPRR